MLELEFLITVQPKQTSPLKEPFTFKNSKEVNLKTRTAATDFFSSPPFFLLALFIFPFLVLFQQDFRTYFAFGFWSFSQSKDCNFRSVRFQISSKIILWLLRLPLHKFSLTYRHPQIYNFHFFEAFCFLLVKSDVEKRGGQFY